MIRRQIPGLVVTTACLAVIAIATSAGWPAWVVIPIVPVPFAVIWMWLESRLPPHTHDEGDHGRDCPGCFAEKVRR